MLSSIFVFLLPSVLGIKFVMKFNENRKIKDIIIDYLLLVLLSNLILMLIVIIINKFDGNIFDYSLEHLKFSVKYICLSLIINFTLSIIYSVFIKCVDIKIEVKHEDKKVLEDNIDSN